MAAGIKHIHINDLEGGAHFKLPHVGGEQVKEALKKINFSIPYKPKGRISYKCDIPYLCGYDTKEDLVYFDKDFDPGSFGHEVTEEGAKVLGEWLPAELTLLSHEEPEKALEVTDWKYPQRHHVVTFACEKPMVEFIFGPDSWEPYTKWTTRSWHAAYNKWSGRTSGLVVPATLDMSPYTNEDDKVVKAMRAQGAKDSGEEP